MMFGENSHNFIPPEIKTVSANDIAPLYQNGIVEKPLFIQLGFFAQFWLSRLLFWQYWML